MLNSKINKIQIPFDYLITFLFIVNCGFHLKNVPTYASMYIIFYITLVFLFLKSFKHITIPFTSSMKLCSIVILYLFISQMLNGGVIIVVLASIITFIFYIIARILLHKKKIHKILKICDFLFIFNAILFFIDAIYRFKLGGNNILTNFYIAKTNCLLFADTNALAINSCTLTFFAFYLFEKFKNFKYFIFCLIFILFTIFTFSRAAIIATFFSFIIILLYNCFKKIFKYFYKNFSLKIPLKTACILITILPFLCLLIFFIFKVIVLLLSDNSFLTKIFLFKDIFIFVENASLSELCFGIGFDNAYIYLDRYAHTYLATYIIETGFIGYTLITSFLISLLIENKKNFYILLPFFFLGFSYIGHTILNLFYVTFALTNFFETRRRITKC